VSFGGYNGKYSNEVIILSFVLVWGFHCVPVKQRNIPITWFSFICTMVILQSAVAIFLCTSWGQRMGCLSCSQILSILIAEIIQEHVFSQVLTSRWCHSI
jgi:hypothetical protein